MLLFLHFFAVAFYSIWVMYTHPRATTNPAYLAKDIDNSEVVMRRPNPLEYPCITIKAVQVVRPHHLFCLSKH